MLDNKSLLSTCSFSCSVLCKCCLSFLSSRLIPTLLVVFYLQCKWPLASRSSSLRGTLLLDSGMSLFLYLTSFVHLSIHEVLLSRSLFASLFALSSLVLLYLPPTWPCSLCIMIPSIYVHFLVNIEASTLDMALVEVTFRSIPIDGAKILM